MSNAPSVKPLDPEEEAAFLALIHVMKALPRLLDADLIKEQRLSMGEYIALMHLSEAPDRRLRMSELADECNLSLSGMTRLVTRLEAEGCIERVTCTQDGRGSNALLTELGFARLEQAYPTHLASVRRHVVDHWNKSDLAQIAQALGAIGQ